MFLYQTFLDEKGGVLSFEQCQEYHQKILDGMKKGDAELEQYWLDFVKNAIEYTQIRSKWYLISREERQATDESRTNKHNRVIMALKLVVRYLASEGADSSWFDEIESDRKKIGDFAIILLIFMPLMVVKQVFMTCFFCFGSDGSNKKSLTKLSSSRLSEYILFQKR